jgi:hypothetical protein
MRTNGCGIIAYSTDQPIPLDNKKAGGLSSSRLSRYLRGVLDTPAAI